jgi:hypothetical protein
LQEAWINRLDVLATLGLATLGLLWSGCTVAAHIDAEIEFPGGVIPPMTAYAFELDTSRVRTAPVALDQTKFEIKVPRGRYVVFLAPREPGAPAIYGAYTEFSDCLARAAAANPVAGVAAAHCDDHQLIAITVNGKAAHTSVKIDDWYLSDDVAAQLDHLRGAEPSEATLPLGAPRFSEYKVASTDLAPTPKPDLAEIAISAEERVLLKRALSIGPNFAGHLSAVLVPCGGGCAGLRLIDWHDGKLLTPADLAGIQFSLPCRPYEAVVFRRDSRLLSVTRLQGNRSVTQYYVWKPKSVSLTFASEYARKDQQFCAATPP